jgi:hypothetical protein
LSPTTPSRLATILHWTLLALAAVLFALHFLHLSADFPNHSPWVDWSKYTDEGWYSDAAVRHLLFGRWFVPGDFNPGIALPVWPALELFVFRVFGVSIVAARALTLCVFGVTLVTLYRLIARHTRPRSGRSGPPLAAAITVFLLSASPFLFVFDRLAILEPLLICLTALSLLTASHLHPLSFRIFSAPKDVSSRPEAAHLAAGVESPPHLFFALAQTLPTIALTLLLPALILTKTTAIFLFPAIFYLVWARSGYRFRPALRLALPPALGGLALWLAWFLLAVRPHFLADYRYLFSANAYTGIALEPLASVVLNTLADGIWMGRVLYPCLFVALVLVLFWRPRLLTNPLVPTFGLWIGGYFTFLAYHNNLQPRYYLVIAVPVTALVALAIDDLRQPSSLLSPLSSLLPNLLAALLVLAIAAPDIFQQADFLLHPTYDFLAAARSIDRIILADPTHPHLLCSISGSDLTLMTGLPSIDDDFGTLEFAERLKLYRPGWYVAWNDVEDDKADALTPHFALQRVAAFPVMDDPDRNLLILYRLDPTDGPSTQPLTHPRRKTPKPLVTKLGQQPSVDQLQH